jgi:hypothetical protein
MQSVTPSRTTHYFSIPVSAKPTSLYLAWSAVLVKAGAVGLRETVLPLEA